MFSYKNYSENSEYTVAKSSCMLRWDHAAKLFRAQVPGNAEAISETILQAKDIMCFPENVRFERTSRYILRIEVVDAPQPDTVLENESQSKIKVTTPDDGAHTCDSHIDELDIDRQTPACLSDSLVESTEQCASPPVSMCSYMDEHTPMTRKRHFSWHKEMTTASADENHDLRGGGGGGSDTESKRRKLEQMELADSFQLSQETIQHNYCEFEAIARKCRTEQPDVGDMSFEKIFLGDSELEDWQSSEMEIEDGVSGEMPC